MCGRWNLPIFLLRDGLLTLMNSAIPSAINPKIMDINIFPYTLWCYKDCRENIFFSLEKAHSSERKLGLSQNNISAIEKII